MLDAGLRAAVEEASAIFEEEYPGLSLAIVSGYRSPAQQKALLARWLRGDRRGIAHRPAARSKHSSGRAVDLQIALDGELVPVKDTPREWWQIIAAVLEPAGIVWGGTFSRPDWNHYELADEA